MRRSSARRRRTALAAQGTGIDEGEPPQNAVLMENMAAWDPLRYPAKAEPLRANCTGAVAASTFHRWHLLKQPPGLGFITFLLSFFAAIGCINGHRQRSV